MGVGDTIAFGALVCGIIAICGMLLEGYKSRMRVRERELELRIAEASRAGAPPPADPALEQRVRVLERIATDKTATLAAQIDHLRDPVN